MDGIEATGELARVAPESKVLILTTFEDDDYIFRSLRAGASGFLLKRTRPEELIAAVHTVAAGDSLLAPSVTRRVSDRMAQQPTPALADNAILGKLTPRECQVLDQIADWPPREFGARAGHDVRLWRGSGSASPRAGGVRRRAPELRTSDGGRGSRRGSIHGASN